jgi:hypothetical protein
MFGCVYKNWKKKKKPIIKFYLFFALSFNLFKELGAINFWLASKFLNIHAYSYNALYNYLELKGSILFTTPTSGI